MIVIYIHGFLSSPESAKAKQAQLYCNTLNDVQFICPFLSAYPDQVLGELENLIVEHSSEKIGLIGSSMGGFYATYLSQRHQIPAALVNPAVHPQQLMMGYLHRTLRNYHTEDSYVLDDNHAQKMHELDKTVLLYPSLLWLLAQTGDETLDYRLAVERYRPCRQTIEKGGDHSFQNFDQHLPGIIDFLLAQVK